MAAELPELIVPDQQAWRAWLARHHGSSAGVWLVLAKRGSARSTSLTYDAALEEALCFGWIDGQLGRRDDATYRQRFTPRRPTSAWSKRNVGIAGRLLASRRMHAAGVAAVESARADGRWQRAYAGPATAVVPPDLNAALRKNRTAATMFRALDSQNRYAILYRIQALKTEKGRARKIDEVVSMLARGETIYPRRRAPQAKPG